MVETTQVFGGGTSGRMFWVSAHDTLADPLLPISVWSPCQALYYYFSSWGAHARPTEPGKVKAKSKSSWAGRQSCESTLKRGLIAVPLPPLNLLCQNCQTLIQSLSSEMSIFFYSISGAIAFLSMCHETRGFVMYFASFTQNECEVFTKEIGGERALR